MNKFDLIYFFKALSENEQLSFICRLAHLLTVSARATYLHDSDGVSDPQILRWLNEAQHYLLGQACNLAEGNSQRYSDEVFCEGLVLRAEHPMYGKIFTKALNQVVVQMNG
jgi:hypothetical protein